MPIPAQNRRALRTWVLAVMLMAGPVEASHYEEIAALLSGDAVQTQVEGERMWFTPWLRELFADEAIQPHWRSAQLAALRVAIARSRDDGLDPKDFLAARLDDTSGLPDGAKELLATEALARLAFSLRLGKTDPAALDRNWNYSRNFADVDPVVWLRDTVRMESLDEALDAVRPSTPAYRLLVQALQVYRKRQEHGSWPLLPEGAALKPGMIDARIQLLRARLADSGDLAPDDAAAPTNDVYDEALLAAVRSFQERHGLAIDGAVGHKTLAALNVPIAQRIDQLRINLDRLRWVAADFEREFVAVNIAAYSATYTVDGEIRWRGRAIVGRPSRPTPIFRDQLSYIRLNPSWTVPPTILRQDVLPGVRRDPAYLREHRLRLIAADGSIVDPASVDWRHAKASNFPYTLRQDPGAENALGRVALMFPNRHTVYLHDTPTRELFATPERMLSSGCVRIENPVALAEMLVDDPVQWNREMLDTAIATDKTLRIDLPRKIPIMLLYFTAFPGEDGRIHFRQDLYGRDQAVLDALNAPFHRKPSEVVELSLPKQPDVRDSAGADKIGQRTSAPPDLSRAVGGRTGVRDSQNVTCHPV